MTSPSVAVIVLNWNGWAHTLECLEALSRLSRSHDILVVDNGSTDGSEQQIRARHPNLRLLQTGKNLGYAGGNNLGIRRALADGADYVWILNNDARPRPHALEALLRVMEDQTAIGVLSSSVAPCEHPTASLKGNPVSCVGCGLEWHDADLVEGASLFFRSMVLLEVGVFDERYFHYSEERDLAMRIRQANWRLGHACTSVVDHTRGATLPGWSPQASYYMLRNLVLFERRFYGTRTLPVLLRHRRRLRASLAVRTSIRQRDMRRVVAVALAIADGTRGRTGQRDLGEPYQQVWRS